MKTIEEIARRYWAAEASRDVAAIMEFFAPDAEWHGPGVSARGHDEIRPFYQQSAELFPGLEVEVVGVNGGAEEAALQWRAVFTDTAGERYDAAGVNVMRGDGERITSLTTYYDPSTLAPRKPAPVQVAIADRFAGRRVLVTGAGSGIGAATVRQFVAEGAHVTGADVNGEGLDAVHASLGARADAFQPVVDDVTDQAKQVELLSAASGADGALDVLVNNAAVFLLSGLHATDDDWRRTLDVNLLAPAQLVAKAADALARSTAGAVVNIASISGHVSQVNRWTYNAAKGGVLSLTRCQALDLAPRGVRVNSVSPGFVWTEVLDRGAGGDRAKWEPVWGSYAPLQRCAEPFEVSAAIAFLASGAASFITGTDLLVDGGLVSMSPEGLRAYEFSS